MQKKLLISLSAARRLCLLVKDRAATDAHIDGQAAQRCEGVKSFRASAA